MDLVLELMGCSKKERKEFARKMKEWAERDAFCPCGAKPPNPGSCSAQLLDICQQMRAERKRASKDPCSAAYGAAFKKLDKKLKKELRRMPEFGFASEGSRVAWRAYKAQMKDCLAAAEAVLADMQQLHDSHPPVGDLQGEYGALIEAHKKQQEAARASLKGLRDLFRAEVHRRHNQHRSSTHLLTLPDNVLADVIHKAGGKRLRGVCARLSNVHGAPGAALLPRHHPHCKCNLLKDEPALIATLSAWPYPAHLRALHLHECGVTFTGPLCKALATALPALRELSCPGLKPAVKSARHTPTHPALTALTVLQPTQDTAAVTTFAPHLRSLMFLKPLRGQNLTPASVWGALCLLSGLQALHMCIGPNYPATAAFYSAMLLLPGLTHLGVDLARAGDAPHQHAIHSLLGAALATLPALRSLRLCGTELAGSSRLGAAVQALPLRALVLAEAPQDPKKQPGSSPSSGALLGALPDLTAMPHLTSFHLYLLKSDLGLAEGRQLIGSRSAGHTLRCLVLEALEAVDPQLLGELLGQLPCLTTLSCSGWVQRGESHADEARLQAASDVLSQQTQLRRLHIGVLPHAMIPALCTLTNLTTLLIGCIYCLRGPRLHEGEEAADAAPVDFRPVLQALTSLRRLGVRSLHKSCGWGFEEPRCDRKQFLEGVRQLPLLEDLDLGAERYEKQELLLLLPTPDRLQRVLVEPLLLQQTCDVLQTSVLVESRDDVGAVWFG